MSTYTLQAVGQDGELIKESKLELQQGDKLIVKAGWLDEQQTKPVPKQATEAFHQSISNWLESRDKVLVIPHFLELQVLSQK